MANKHTGSCLCGKVAFEIVGDFESFFLCHCKHCQKDTGSAFAANLFSATAKLNWLGGEEKIQTFTLPGTRHMKSFCLECSSALPSLQMNGQVLVAPAGSFDTEVLTKPTAHIFCSSKASWEDLLMNIAKFDTFPS